MKRLQKYNNKKIVALIIALAIISAMPPFAAAATSRAVVWGAANSADDSVRVRSGPGLNYDILTHAGRGDPVVIIERTNSEWYKINYSGTIGYMSVPLLERPRTKADFNATGVVTGSDVNMREKPNTNASAVTVCQANTTVGIIGLNEGWYKVSYNDKIGYIRSDLMDLVSISSNQPSGSGTSSSSSSSSITGTLTGNKINLREKPSTSAKVLGTYPVGTVVTVYGIENNWYKVSYNGTTGYMHPDYVRTSSKPPNISSYTGDVKTPPAASSSSAYVKPSGNAPAYNAALSQKIVDYALTLKGSKYVYGGTSPSGFDCSGFVYYVFSQFDIRLTRNASGQYRDNGTHIAITDLLPGDLVFTSSNGGASVTHVGIYIGDDQMVHAQTVDTGVVISKIGGNNTHYGRTLFGAKRIV